MDGLTEDELRAWAARGRPHVYVCQTDRLDAMRLEEAPFRISCFLPHAFGLFLSLLPDARLEVARRLGSTSLQIDSHEDLPRMLRAVMMAVLRGIVPVAEFPKLLESEEVKAVPGVAVLVADLFSLTEVELLNGGDTALHPKLIALIKECVSAVSENVLKERLEPSTLSEAKLVPSADDMEKSIIRVRTKVGVLWGFGKEGRNACKEQFNC